MSDQFLGEIRIFAGKFAPKGWAFCDGRLLAISDNDALFALIGTIYGGDGQTTFALPDLRGRLPVNQGSGPGLTPRRIGEQFGVESVALTDQEMPAHSHSFAATTAAATSASPTNALFADTGSDPVYVPPPETPELQAMNPGAVADAGLGQPHNNIMPSLAMNYIIALVGLFPSRA